MSTLVEELSNCYDYFLKTFGSTLFSEQFWKKFEIFPLPRRAKKKRWERGCLQNFLIYLAKCFLSLLNSPNLVSQRFFVFCKSNGSVNKTVLRCGDIIMVTTVRLCRLNFIFLMKSLESKKEKLALILFHYLSREIWLGDSWPLRPMKTTISHTRKNSKMFNIKYFSFDNYGSLYVPHEIFSLFFKRKKLRKYLCHDTTCYLSFFPW